MSSVSDIKLIRTDTTLDLFVFALTPVARGVQVGQHGGHQHGGVLQGRRPHAGVVSPAPQKGRKRKERKERNNKRIRKRRKR